MRLGFFLTFLYFLIVIFFIVEYSDHTERLKPNEWGDLLAGICGPVAFAWLIFGYRQQGEQLRQNTQAINAQMEALVAQKEELTMNRAALERQAIELAHSAEQQKLLVETEQQKFDQYMRRQWREKKDAEKLSEEQKRARQPIFILEHFDQKLFDNAHKDEGDKYTNKSGIFLRNVGSPCTLMNFYFHTKQGLVHIFEQDKYCDTDFSHLVYLPKELALSEEFESYHVDYLDTARNGYSVWFSGERKQIMRGSEPTDLADC